MSNKENTRIQFHDAICEIANSNQPLRQRIYNAFINHLSNISDDDIPNNLRGEWDFILESLSFRIPKKIETKIKNLTKEGVSQKSIDNFINKIEKMHPPLFLKEIHHTKIKRISNIICNIYQDLYTDLEEEVLSLQT